MRKLIHRIQSRFLMRCYKIVLLGSAMLLSGVGMTSEWDPPVSTDRRPEIHLPRHPWIALTFDDGPHPGKTPQLLQVLKDEQVPATFFVVGKMAERFPQLVEEIARDGNEIANHTYSHTRLTNLDDRAVLNELNQTQAILRRLTGRNSYLFRPPGGDYSRETVRVASRAGYHMVLWSILTNDVQGSTPKQMYRRIMNNAEDGGIILMHSGMDNSVEALPRVIASLRQRGFHFVTVSTLMGLAPVPGLLPPPPEVPLPTTPQPVPLTLRQRLVYKTTLHALL